MDISSSIDDSSSFLDHLNWLCRLSNARDIKAVGEIPIKNKKEIEHIVELFSSINISSAAWLLEEIISGEFVITLLPSAMVNFSDKNKKLLLYIKTYLNPILREAGYVSRLIEIKTKKCPLCLVGIDLVESHIIPSFVFKWIKETSATGLIRSGIDPERRLQDGNKPRLLCGCCDNSFSSVERNFSNTIFYPYASSFHESAEQENTFLPVRYEDWLLKFAVFTQWKVLCVQSPLYAKHFSPKQKSALNEAFCSWRQFLIGEKTHTGAEEHHMLLLMPTYKAKSAMPERLPGNVNHYIMRAADYQILYTSNSVSVYTKLGPIVIYTAVRPSSNKYLRGTRIKLKGQMERGATYGDVDLNEYIYVTRPEEISQVLPMTEKVATKIEKTIRKDMDKAAASLTMKAKMADEALRRGKKPF